MPHCRGDAGLGFGRAASGGGRLRPAPLHKSGRDSGRGNPEYKKHRECHPGEIRGVQLVDEILRPLHRIGRQLRNILTRFEQGLTWPNVLGQYEDLLTRWLPIASA